MPSPIDHLTAWFGPPPNQKSKISNQKFPIPLPSPGQILLLTGPSGAGKSSLLRSCRRRLPTCINLARIPLPPRPLTDLFPSLDLPQTLAALSRVGLAEARLYRLQPHQLSTGQRWRLRLALALHHAHCLSAANPSACLISDEFAAPLDNITAAIIAHLLRISIDRDRRLRAIVATARDDITQALRPDRIIECDFGQITIHEEIPHARH